MGVEPRSSTARHKRSPIYTTCIQTHTHTHTTRLVTLYFRVTEDEKKKFLLYIYTYIKRRGKTVAVAADSFSNRRYGIIAYSLSFPQKLFLSFSSPAASRVSSHAMAPHSWTFSRPAIWTTNNTTLPFP